MKYREHHLRREQSITGKNQRVMIDDGREIKNVAETLRHSRYAMRATL